MLYKERKHLNVAFRVDGEDTLFRDFSFRLAQGLIGGKDLPIEVGDRHRVKVNDSQIADTASDQGFQCHSPDRPKTDYHHVFLMKAFYRFLTKQSCYA
jgi:hypothetical protein